jgi:hypothetical protein
VRFGAGGRVRGKKRIWAKSNATEPLSVAFIFVSAFFAKRKSTQGKAG